MAVSKSASERHRQTRADQMDDATGVAAYLRTRDQPAISDELLGRLIANARSKPVWQRLRELTIRMGRRS